MSNGNEAVHFTSFGVELEDSLQLPTDNSATLSILDSALRRFLSLSAAYHGVFHSLPSCMPSDHSQLSRTISPDTAAVGPRVYPVVGF